MATANRSRATLELEPGADPIRGRIERPDGTDRPFWGWLELIEEVRQLAAAQPPQRVTTAPDQEVGT